MLTKFLSSFVRQLKPNRVSGRSKASLELPAPQIEGGTPLMTALSNRRSSREFSAEALPLELLSNLLWAAYGINRPTTAGRTAPSALNAQEIDVYAALPNGLYLYDAQHHRLHLIAAVDARRLSGYQDFVDEAPLDLIYVADSEHLTAIPKDQRAIYSATSAGAISQNVYLYCASVGLATVVRALLDRDVLGSVMGLGSHEVVLLSQTVGFPA